VLPDWVIELAAITVINWGKLLGAPELLPVELVHVPPQDIGLGLVELAKPLKLFGAAPPLKELR